MPERALHLAPAQEQALGEAVSRIVATAAPQAVILFGSQAEGRASADSDLDLLVIADTADTGALTEDVAVALADMRRGRWHELPCFDVLVYTPQEFRHESTMPGMLAHRISRHGVTVYGRVA